MSVSPIVSSAIFSDVPGHEESYITTIEEYDQKILETFEFGGEQLLLQGGHHPDLGLDYYADLFRTLKSRHPRLKLHALGPPEIAHIAKLEETSHTEVLRVLKEAGLDSLPGAGAEILSDRVRRLISKGKCGSEEWPRGHESSTSIKYYHFCDHDVWPCRNQ